jgi:hypothetical protein
MKLFTIVESAEAAVDEIATFYRVFHSIRFVDRLLVMRLTRRLTDGQLDILNTEFADLLDSGTYDQRSAFPNEADEPEFLNLPRLVFRFHRRSAGRLRQLIDRINGFSKNNAE